MYASSNEVITLQTAKFLREKSIRNFDLVIELLSSNEPVIEAGNGGIIRNFLDDKELEFTRLIVKNEGGVFIGQKVPNTEGIDGFYYVNEVKIPVSLKELTTKNARKLLKIINENIEHIIEGKYGLTDIYIKLQNISFTEIKTFAENGPLIRIPSEGNVRKIIIYTSEGIYKIP